jgi:signal transduction histidine kinase
MTPDKATIQDRLVAASGAGAVECLKGLGLDERVFGHWVDLSAFYDAAPVGFAALSRKGVVHNTNLQTTVLLNTYRSELIGRSLYDFVVRQDRDVLYLHLRKLFTERRPQSCELRLQSNRVDGPGCEPMDGTDHRIRHVLMESTYEDNVVGPHTSRTVLSDISHLKELEERLRRSHAELEQRIEIRTAQLNKTNRELNKEIAIRKKTEQRLKSAYRRLTKTHMRRVVLSKKLVGLLEQERESIAMELHDNIGQVLTTINLELELLKCGRSEGATQSGDRIERLQELVRGSIDQVRNVCRGLRPDILDHLGLIPAISNLAESAGKNLPSRIHVSARDIPDMNKNTELTLYRIAQEAITNIIRHAGAKNVFVDIDVLKNKVRLKVKDDGTGFDSRKLEAADVRTRSLGLLIMKERALQAGGSLRFESETGKGTRVLATLPIRPKGSHAEPGKENTDGP